MKTKLLLFFAFITLGLTAQETYNLGWSTSGDSAGQRLSIEVGDTVVWTWGPGTHNLAQIDDISEPGFADSYFSEGHVYSHTFTNPGTHDYLCSPHPNSMNGIITVSEASAPSSDLALQGILDIDGGFKKGVHVRATADIADLSIYKLQVYSNANTTAGSSYTLLGSALAGDDILIANDGDALDAYMSISTIFDTVFNTGTFPSINGDDSIELLMNDSSVEVYGEIGVDGNAANPSEVWEYTDSWAYKVDGAWTYGGVGCTDGSDTTWESSCVYPLAIGQNPLGLDDVVVSEFTFFPNPVNNVLSIKAQASIDGITIFNMLGQAVVRSTPNTTDSTVDMSALQTGAYFVQVSINNTLKTVRVIKN